ncbi:MAG: 4Fe-4S binding protein [Desulfobacterales bacterium]|nr:4Fe-4S binding protein [Desulfobacterales bacterium]
MHGLHPVRESVPRERRERTERRQVHSIDQQKCTQCGACYDACPFDAIIRE